MEILDAIPFEVDFRDLARRAHIEPGSDDAAAFEALCATAVEVAQPKAAYTVGYIDARGDDTVTINGTTFTSRVLRTNLAEVERVFAYVATCGCELAQIELAPGDFLAPYWRDALCAAALGCAVKCLNEHLSAAHALGHTAHMNPGSGDASVWPIEQQPLLFGLIGDVKGAIGVELTESCLMLPTKSVSGIRFPTAIDFESCRLCHREDCPSRRAPFDAELYESLHVEG